MDEILETELFKKISKTNDKDFALRLALWLIRYVLVVSSLDKIMENDLEETLIQIHEDTFKKILEFRQIIYRIAP